MYPGCTLGEREHGGPFDVRQCIGRRRLRALARFPRVRAAPALHRADTQTHHLTRACTPRSTHARATFTVCACGDDPDGRRSGEAPSAASSNPSAANSARNFSAPVHVGVRGFGGVIPATLRACGNRRERVSCNTPTVAANRLALTACGPSNRCTIRAFNAALYVCIRSNPVPPSGDRHDRCGRTDHATTFLTQGATVYQYRETTEEGAELPAVVGRQVFRVARDVAEAARYSNPEQTA